MGVWLHRCNLLELGRRVSEFFVTRAFYTQNLTANHTDDSLILDNAKDLQEIELEKGGKNVLTES